MVGLFRGAPGRSEPGAGPPCIFGYGVAGLALVGNLAVLVLVVLDSAERLNDVGINAAAADIEQVSERRFMSFLHAVLCGAMAAGEVGDRVGRRTPRQPGDPDGDGAARGPRHCARPGHS